MMSIEFRDWVNERALEYLPVDRIKQGDKIMVKCPLCGDSKKNALRKRGYYYLKTASYHCFNCGESMSGMKLLERLSGTDYAELKKQYFKMTFDGKHFNTAISNDPFEQNKSKNILNFTNVVKPEWKKELSKKAKDYLKNRLVLNAPFLKEKLFSYYSKKGDEYILIPWKMNGIDCYFQLNDFEKHNTMGMKYIFPKKMDKLIYGLDNIDLRRKYIIITEGVYDSLFIPNCVCVGGKSVSDIQLDIIRKRYPNMKLYMSFDNDKPGIDSMKKSFNDKRYDFGYFKWFDKDTKEKDINDFIKKVGDVNYFKNNDISKMFKNKLVMKLELSNI